MFNFSAQQQHDDQAWLKHNDAPFDVLQVKWKATAAYRKQTIDEVEPPSKLEKILDNWPRFKDAVGPTLVSYVVTNQLNFIEKI